MKLALLFCAAAALAAPPNRAARESRVETARALSQYASGRFLAAIESAAKALAADGENEVAFAALKLSVAQLKEPKPYRDAISAQRRPAWLAQIRPTVASPLAGLFLAALALCHILWSPARRRR